MQGHRDSSLSRLWHLSYEERLGLFNMEQRKLTGILHSHILEQVVQRVCGVFTLGDIQHPDRWS